MAQSTEPLYLNRITRWDDTTWAKQHSEALVRYLGQFRTVSPSRELTRALARAGYDSLPEEALRVVTAQENLTGDDAFDAFVRDAVTIAAPHTAYAAKLLLTDAVRYVTWCVRDNGWPLDAETIWSIRAIDLYSTTANQHLSEGSRRNYRSRLLRISEVLVPHEHPERVTALSKRQTSAPYTATELATFRDWAIGQLTPQKRDRAMLMLVLCAGAGVRPSEIPLVHPNHIQVDDEGVVVTVATDVPRHVPLLAEWEDWMTALLGRLPADGSLWGKVNRRTTSNLTSSFTENSYGNPPRADRLRHTWMLRHLDAGIPMKDFCRAAGITKMQHLHLLLDYSDFREESDFRRTFRGAEQA